MDDVTSDLNDPAHLPGSGELRPQSVQDNELKGDPLTLDTDEET